MSQRAIDYREGTMKATSRLIADRGEVSALRQYLPAVLAFLEPLCEPWVPIVARHLRRSLDAAAGRGNGGTRASQARSTAKRAAVRKTIAALPAGLDPRWVTGKARNRLLRNLALYGLDRLPCDTLIRDEVRKRYPRTEIAQPTAAARSNLSSNSATKGG